MTSRTLPAVLVAFLAFARLTSYVSAIEHTKDSLDAVKKNMETKKALLIDVRNEDEWKAGHLALAKLIPLGKIKEAIPEKELDKTKIIYLHCRSGGRSLVAAEILAKAGYDARPLKQGFEELAKNGFVKAEDK